MTRPRGYLFVLPWNPTSPGGVDQVVLNVYRQFELGGAFKPAIMVTSWDHPEPSQVQQDGKAITFMRLRAPAITLAGLAKWAFFCFPEILRLHRYLRAQNIAVVNVHYPGLAAIQFILVRKLFYPRLRVILSFHGMDITRAATLTGIGGWLLRVLFRNADEVVACSHALTAAIIDLEPSLKSRALTIRNGIDIDHLLRSRDPRARLDARLSERPFVLTVAAYEQKKGLDTLLRAFKIVRERSENGLALVLVGVDRGIGGELIQLAGELRLADDVFLVGAVPHSNLHVFYESAMVFCLPSRVEPFGIVLLEAGAFRLPVVATNVGGIPEILTHEANARLVAPDDPPALAAELLRLLEDAAERKRLGEALFRHVQKDFSWESAYRQYLEISLSRTVSAPS